MQLQSPSSSGMPTPQPQPTSPTSTGVPKKKQQRKRGCAIGLVMLLFLFIIVGNMFFGMHTIRELRKLPQRFSAWRGGPPAGFTSIAPWAIPGSLLFRGLATGNRAIDPKIPRGVTFSKSSPNGMTESLLCQRYCHLDIVYTWVNGSDIPFKFKKFSTIGKIDPKTNPYVDRELRRLPLGAVMDKLQAANSQDKENDELKNSLRGMKQHMRWHRGRTVLVSPGHVPTWLDQRRIFFGVSFTEGKRRPQNNSTSDSDPQEEPPAAWWSTESNAQRTAIHRWRKAADEELIHQKKAAKEESPKTTRPRNSMRKYQFIKGEGLPHDDVAFTRKKEKSFAPPVTTTTAAAAVGKNTTTAAPLYDYQMTKPPADHDEEIIFTSIGSPRDHQQQQKKSSISDPSSYSSVVEENPRFVVLYQDVLVPEHRRLRFSSNVVEPVLYKVPDLSNVFVHMNDDYIILNTTSISTFLNERGGPNLFFETGLMVGGRPQYEQLKIEGTKPWLCGVYHTHAVIHDILDKDLGTNSRYRQIFGYVRWRNGTLIPGNLTTRFFAKHAPFSYSKKILQYLDQYEVAGKFYDTVATKMRHCDDVYVPFLHHAIAVDAPWRGCLDDVTQNLNLHVGASDHGGTLWKGLGHLLDQGAGVQFGLGQPHFVRNEAEEVMQLSKTIQCPAPATVKIGLAAENTFLMLTDNMTTMPAALNFITKPQAPGWNLKFLTINDGFTNPKVGELLRQWLRFHFPKPTMNELPLHLPGQPNVRVLSPLLEEEEREAVETEKEGNLRQEPEMTNNELLTSLIEDYFGEEGDLSRDIADLERKKKQLRYMHHNHRHPQQHHNQTDNVSQTSAAEAAEEERERVREALISEVDKSASYVATKRKLLGTPMIIVASSRDVACPMVRSLELALPMLTGHLHVIIDTKDSKTEKDSKNFKKNLTSPLSYPWMSRGDDVFQEPADIGFSTRKMGERMGDPTTWRAKCFFEANPEKQILHFHIVKSEEIRSSLRRRSSSGRQEEGNSSSVDESSHLEYDPVALVDFVNRETNHSIRIATEARRAAKSSAEFRNSAFVIQWRDFLLGQSLALEDFEEYQLSTNDSMWSTKLSFLALLKAAPKRVGSISFSSLWYAINSFLLPYCKFELCFVYI